MAVLDILIYPDPRLRIVGTKVEKITPEVKSLLNDMVETMYAAQGIGLAASQVGSTLRLIVVDVEEEEDQQLVRRFYKIVNPEIVSSEGFSETDEGCLSIPGIRETVKRPASVVVAGMDEEGNPLRIDAQGLLAVCLQHEIDHINGVLFIDHLSKLKRELAKRRFKKLQQEG